MPATRSVQDPRAVRIEHRRRHPGGAQVPDDGQAVEPGQPEIENDAVVILCLAEQPGFLPVIRGFDDIARL